MYNWVNKLSREKRPKYPLCVFDYFFFYNYDEVILFIHNLLKICVVITYIMTMRTSECASFIYETVQSFVILSTAAMRTRCLAFKMCTLYPFV